MAEGTIAANGVVSAVTNMAGIHAISGGVNTDYVALRGSDTGLEIGWQKNTNETAASCIDLSDGGAGSCSLAALTFVKGDTNDFTIAQTITDSLALFDNNPISMTVSAFVQTDVATSSFGSTLR